MRVTLLMAGGMAAAAAAIIAAAFIGATTVGLALLGASLAGGLAGAYGSGWRAEAEFAAQARRLGQAVGVTGAGHSRRVEAIVSNLAAGWSVPSSSRQRSPG